MDNKERLAKLKRIQQLKELNLKNIKECCKREEDYTDALQLLDKLLDKQLISLYKED